MAILELSTGLKTGLQQRLLNPTLSAQTIDVGGGLFPLTPLLPYNFSTSQSNPIVGYLNIYKAALTDVLPLNLNTVLQSLTSYDTRSADILISYETRLVNDFIESSVFTTNPAVINTEFKTSYLGRSGTATWFRWFSYVNAAPYPIIHQIVGSVGVLGSDADLTMSSTNIQPTGLYKIGKFRMNFSGVFNY